MKYCAAWNVNCLPLDTPQSPGHLKSTQFMEYFTNLSVTQAVWRRMI